MKNVEIHGNAIEGFKLSLSGLTMKELLEIAEKLKVEIRVEQTIEDPVVRSQLKEIFQEAKEGHKLGAVKMIKDLTGAGLKESKDMLDDNYERMRNENNYIVFWLSAYPHFPQSMKDQIAKAFSSAELRDYRGAITGVDIGILD